MSISATGTTTSSLSSASASVPQNGSSAVQLDPIKNMCGRFGQQSTVKNGTLYIDGGVQTFVNLLPNGTQDTSANITEGYNTYLIEVDLTSEWNWQIDDPPVQENAINKTTNPSTGSLPPLVRSGALFSGHPEDSKIYLYGGTTDYWNTSFPGYQPPTSDVYLLWSYDLVDHIWGQYDISAQSKWRPGNGISVEAPALGLAFYFNGQIDYGSSMDTQQLGVEHKIFLQGMIVLNTTDQTAVNVSTDAVVGTQPRTRGGAVYIPDIGGSGVLAIFGGTYKQVQDISNEETVNYVDMAEIDIFDVGAYLRKEEILWYKQMATGDIPKPRTYFCTVMISAPDNSTHSIYLYSGSGESEVFDDIYVLSIPSFVWTFISSGASPRYGHTCHLVGDQMLTVGGMSSYDFSAGCDWETKGVAIFNVSSLNWGQIFRPIGETLPYSIDTKLLDGIRGVNGTEALIRPANGWTDESLGRVFGDPEVSKKHGITAGGLAGIVVGVAAFLIAVATGTWCVMMKMKKKKKPVVQEEMVGHGEDEEWRPPDRQFSRIDESLRSRSGVMPSGGGLP